MEAYLINYVSPTEANCGFRIISFLTSYSTMIDNQKRDVSAPPLGFCPAIAFLSYLPLDLFHQHNSNQISSLTKELQKQTLYNSRSTSDNG